MKYPVCIKGTPAECAFSRGHTQTTVMAWIPEYNRKGELVNTNPNISSSSLACSTCGTVWWTKTQHGRTEITIQLPKKQIQII